MAAVLKLCVVLICLGLVESLVKHTYKCYCDECKITKSVSFKKPIYRSTTYRQRCTTSCGFWGWGRCTRYRMDHTTRSKYRDKVQKSCAVSANERRSCERPSCRRCCSN